MTRSALPTTRFLKSSEEICDALVKHARAADCWYFCVSHARHDDDHAGLWNALAEHLPKLKYAAIGLGQHQTDPRVLDRFYQLGKLRIINPDSTEGTFHANVFAFESKSRFVAVVGGMALGASESENCREAAVETTCRRYAAFEDAVVRFMTAALSTARMVSEAELQVYQRSLREKQPLLERLRTFTGGFTEQQFVRACRAAARKKPGVTEREFLRLVARELKFDSPWPELRTKLEEHLRIAVSRQIIAIRDGRVRAKSAAISDYTRPQLVECIVEVLEPGLPVDREVVLDRVRRHLGFPRTSKLFRDCMKSAIHSALRQGKLRRIDAKRVARTR